MRMGLVVQRAERTDAPFHPVALRHFLINYKLIKWLNFYNYFHLMATWGWGQSWSRVQSWREFLSARSSCRWDIRSRRSLSFGPFWRAWTKWWASSRRAPWRTVPLGVPFPAPTAPLPDRDRCSKHRRLAEQRLTNIAMAGLAARRSRLITLSVNNLANSNFNQILNSKFEFLFQDWIRLKPWINSG